MHRSSMSRARRLSGNVLVTMIGVLLTGSAIVKLVGVPPVVKQLAQLGFFGDRLLFIAFAEIVSAVLFLVPRTRAFGLLLVSSFLGGAIATHMGHGESIAQPAVVLTLAWIATAIRNPEAVWSLANGRVERGIAVERGSLAA